MADQSLLNILISDIIGQKDCSHCRLCLRNLQDDYMKFEDCILINRSSYLTLSSVVTYVLGEEFQASTAVPGLNAVCMECAQGVLQCYKFIDNCRNTNSYICNILDNVTNTLNFNDNVLPGKRSLYLIADEVQSKAILLSNSEEQVYDSRQGTFKKRNFVCFDCDVSFNSLIYLREHHSAVHDTLLCDKCHQTFYEPSELEFHLNVEHHLKCPDCKLYKNTEQSVKDHQAKAHGRYVCEECGKIFRGIDRLKKHEESHSKKECPKCGKKYHTKDFYIRHTKLCVAGKLEAHPFRSDLAQTFTCDKCGKSYSTAGGLRVHNRFVHGNAKRHCCPWCNKTFTAPSYLKAHVIKHTGEKSFKCELCNRNFVSKAALLYHTRRHTGEKPYECKLCQKTFVNSSSRAEHIKSKHIGPTLICDICSRRFVTKWFLKKHISKHEDPMSKLYTRQGPANEPSIENMRTNRVEILPIEDPLML